MKTIFTSLALLMTAFSFSQEIKKRPITDNQINAIFSQWDTPDKPGISVGILNDGEIVYAKGFGLANLEHQIPISPNTKFHIGDLAKEFTVYALLLLEERGQLSFQDDIRNYLPQLKSLKHSISIQQLVHHTSGINNDEVSKALAGWQAEDVFTKDQAYALILNQMKLTTTKEKVQLFSDAGFMILEDLIAKLSNMSYSDFITKEIFEPLKMVNSEFDTQGTVIANKANGYFAQNNHYVNSTINHNHTLISDLYTTVMDMCLWAKELRSPKVGTQQMVNKFDGLSVVNGQQVQEINTSLYTGGHRFWNFRGAKKLYHIEVAGGYASKLIRYPEYDLSVVIMGNDGAYNGASGTAASELYIEDYLEDVQSVSNEIASVKLSRKQLMSFEGNYWDLDSYNARKIHIVNDTLRYFRAPGNESALVPLTKNTFKMVTWGDVNVSFDDNTSPKKMTVKVGDDTFNLLEFDANADWTKNLDIFTGNYFSEALNTSYTIILKEGMLVLTHPRLDSIELNPKIPYVFSGNQRHFSSLSFRKNLRKGIEGFNLSTSGVSNIWFQREKIPVNQLTKAK